MTVGNDMPGDRPITDAGECPVCGRPQQGCIRPTPFWGEQRITWCVPCDRVHHEVVARADPLTGQGRLFEVG